MRRRRDLVVVGASAGGLPALQTLLGKLPPDLPMAMLVVVHSSPNPGRLASVLNRGSTYPVTGLNELADAWDIDGEESERRGDDIQRLIENGLLKVRVPETAAVRPARRGTQRG